MDYENTTPEYLKSLEMYSIKHIKVTHYMLACAESITEMLAAMEREGTREKFDTNMVYVGLMHIIKRMHDDGVIKMPSDEPVKAAESKSLV